MMNESLNPSVNIENNSTKLKYSVLLDSDDDDSN